VFTARDAGRIVCEARSNGYSAAEIKREIGNCLGEPEECDCEYLKSVVESQIAVTDVMLVMLALLVPLVRVAPKLLALVRTRELVKAEYDMIIAAARQVAPNTRLMEASKRDLLTAKATAFDIGKGAEVIIKP
jgi:hypothetical protein